MIHGADSEDIKEEWNDDGYFDDFEHCIGSENLGDIRQSTDEFLRIKQQFWETHKDSLEETIMINQMAEYHEQLQLLKEMGKQENAQHHRQPIVFQ